MGGLTSKDGKRLPIHDNRLSSLRMIIGLLRYDFRVLFGLEYANQCGFFVDYHLSRNINAFVKITPDYPKGNHNLKGHDSYVHCAVVSSDGHYLYTGSETGTVIVFDLITHRIITEFTPNDATAKTTKMKRGASLTIACSDDLFACGGGTNIYIHHAYGNLELKHTLIGHSGLVNTIDFSNDGTTLISGAKDNSVRRWNVSNGECLGVWNGHSDWVNAVRFIHECQVLSVSKDATVRVIDLNDHIDEQRTINVSLDGSAILDASLNCDVSLLACVSNKGSYIWTWPDLALSAHQTFRASVCCFHPLDPSVLAIEVGLWIQLWDVSANQLIHQFPKSSPSLTNCLRFTPDGSRLVSTSDDCTIGVWDCVLCFKKEMK